VEQMVVILCFPPLLHWAVVAVLANTQLWALVVLVVVAKVLRTPMALLALVAMVLELLVKETMVVLVAKAVPLMVVAEAVGQGVLVQMEQALLVALVAQVPHLLCLALL
jgi:hypothetical protein